ncbi:hypothetical protein [Qipengyuania nanhaisediminis]|uniref:hypothetical protein n=1 Tax=Qipengyuania nanhaisediminis TaxID=604088 RepID=UPI0038B2BFC1
MTRPIASRRRGMPLAMLCLMLGAWVMGRAAVWENPFAIEALPFDPTAILAENAQGGAALKGDAEPRTTTFAPAIVRTNPSELPLARLAAASRRIQPPERAAAFSRSSMTSALAAGHHMLMAAAFRVDFGERDLSRSEPGNDAGLARAPAYGPVRQPGPAAPFVVRLPPRAESAADRWSLDAFAFYRQGSDAASVTQGRAPVYGASQASASFRYRLAPSSGHDPRAFVRGYRALVDGGESEAAAGVSARPVGALPVRVAAEWRVTDNAFGTGHRPAAYVVTEFAPLELPLGIRAETYASAGYVGGDAATAFADGQAAVTRDILALPGPGRDPVRLSLGGGAWGGAQEDAYRVDVGPTVRFDVTLGSVPARLSLDWREQVAGDAAPGSGLAATLSTRF